MTIVILICCILNLILLLALLSIRRQGGAEDTSEVKSQLEVIRQTNAADIRRLSEQTAQQGDSFIKQMLVLSENIAASQDRQQNRSSAVLKQIEAEMNSLRRENLESLDKIRTSLINIQKSNFDSMDRLRRENQESLDKINDTVNEKLQKTLDDKISRSFETVNKRLAEVYEGLGEMKNVAVGVSDLKNVLANVKTRGIMGEIQLGGILSEILAPEQYGEQLCLAPGTAERVDFAVKLPGAADGEYIYLPIDSKFPGDTYANLIDAYNAGNPELLKERRKLLENEIIRCAKSIHNKYIMPPYTTNFAIMFLPFEGLYSEVVNMGMLERLQREFAVNIAGPSTMAAMLNSLQMGFKTLAIQKKSGEVWKILEAAKKEFSNFETVLDKTRDRLRQADNELEKLIGTRTRAINRKLSTVSALTSDEEAENILTE